MWGMTDDWPYSTVTVRKETAERFREHRDTAELSSDGALRRMLMAYEDRTEEPGVDRC